MGFFNSRGLEPKSLVYKSYSRLTQHYYKFMVKTLQTVKKRFRLTDVLVVR